MLFRNSWAFSEGMALLLVLPNLAPGQSVPPLPVVAPAELGFDAERLTAIDEIVAKGIEAKKMPGCVIAFGHGGFTGTVIWIDPEQDWFFLYSQQPRSSGWQRPGESTRGRDCHAD